MADDVELFIFAPAQLASQNPSFSKRCIFCRRTCNSGLQFGFKHGGRINVPVFFEFNGCILCKSRPIWFRIHGPFVKSTGNWIYLSEAN